MKTLLPPGIGNAAVDSMFGAYQATLKATTDYWTGAISRRASPVDLGADMLNWFTEVTRQEVPQWASAHHVKAEWPVARLLDFSEGKSPDQIATLILPPQAGHASCIVDFAAHQSQIATAKASGLARAYALEWIGATDETKTSSIEDYIAIVAESVEQLGGVVNLVGDCQGGWLAVIYAALYPDTVNSLAIGGAPIDFHAGEPSIHEWMEVLSPGDDLAFYRNLVSRHNGTLPGEYLLAGFITMQPHVELGRQLQLLADIRQPELVARYRAFETWFKHTQPLPGTFYLWIVEHLFQNNELIAGTLTVGGVQVNLGDITCPLHLLAGATDHITPAPQVYALADYAGTDDSEIHQRLVPGGHLGLFMGHDALDNHWAPVFSAIAQHSDKTTSETSEPA